jgi:hypothetical protein
LLEILQQNWEFIVFLVEQQMHEKKIVQNKPLVPAVVLNEALTELRQDLTLKDCEKLTRYGIIGSKCSIKDALGKAEKLNNFLVDLGQELINMDTMHDSLRPMLNLKRREARSPAK